MKKRDIFISLLGAVLLTVVDVLGSAYYNEIQNKQEPIVKLVIAKKVVHKKEYSKREIEIMVKKIKAKYSNMPYLATPILFKEKQNHIEKLNFSKMAKIMKFIESSDKKEVINSCGFIGYFQFGVASLEDLGYVEKGEYKRMKNMKISQKEFVENHMKWVEGMSFKKFIQKHQFTAFKRYTLMNYRNLEKAGFITGYEDIKYVRGLLFASHLVGVNAVKKILANRNLMYADANGITASVYFHIGYRVV